MLRFILSHFSFCSSPPLPVVATNMTFASQNVIRAKRAQRGFDDLKKRVGVVDPGFSYAPLTKQAGPPAPGHNHDVRNIIQIGGCDSHLTTVRVYLD